ncbi:CotO family spore coat protein [Gracilibacillus sp. S3-1-1]|uniref:CotO family spore coat protein n=1 Tax=Gracilibacillus pellucidus TaxID=3095368 RepID=A0ACC6M4A4_9BACI|nr:CotO family spore coat protein [Gracilibacillus sp. S3-1-1]MDX8045809.1 CotO family spore coat protein [Gracilibacillus sp. S3-1-1]
MDSVNEKKYIPKLYIAQPKIAEPSRVMQSHYHSTTDQEAEEQTDKYVEEKNEEKKKVMDMTMEEKVRYFANMPFHAPRVKCQVVTDKKTYIGIIVDEDEGKVVMRVASRNQPVVIPLRRITEINLVGF